jgi:hypothetical protein
LRSIWTLPNKWEYLMGIPNIGMELVEDVENIPNVPNGVPNKLFLMVFPTNQGCFTLNARLPGMKEPQVQVLQRLGSILVLH